MRNGEEYPLLALNPAVDGRVYGHKTFVERYDKMLKAGEKLESEKVTIRGALMGCVPLVVALANKRSMGNVPVAIS